MKILGVSPMYFVELSLRRSFFVVHPTSPSRLEVLSTYSTIQRRRRGRYRELYLSPVGLGLDEFTVPVLCKVLFKRERLVTLSLSVGTYRLVHSLWTEIR